MSERETPLQMAERHVARQEELIAQQELRIARLERLGLPTQPARNVLTTMQRTLVLFRQDVERLSRSK